MQTPALSEVPAARPQLVGTGAGTDGALSATRFLPSPDENRLPLPGNWASATAGGMDVFMQIVASQTDNQIHDEYLIPADEQWSSRREQLASSGRCTTVTI
jgi:hypothetical protein